MHGNKRWPKRKCRNKLKITKEIKEKPRQKKIKSKRKRKKKQPKISLNNKKKHNSLNKKIKNPSLKSKNPYSQDRQRLKNYRLSKH